MKKLIFTLFIGASVLSGCGHKSEVHVNGSGEIEAPSAQVDNAEAANEVATDSAELTIPNSSQQDSILKVQADEQYKKGLKITSGKKIFTNLGDATVAGKFSRDCEITNNTFVTLEPEDYQIVYKYEDLDTEDGELVPITKTGHKKGQKLLPGESYKTTISIVGEDLSTPTIKLKISKNEFTNRFKDQTVFDKASNEFKAR